MKFIRYEKNPILTPKKSNEWESLCVLNPAVIFNEKDQSFYMFYRCAGNDKKHTISMGLAISKDGINFKRYSSKPILSGEENGLDEGGIEDPRIIKYNDYYYLTYASRVFHPGQYWKANQRNFGFCPKDGPKALQNNNTLTHLAISKDLIHFKKLGPITDPRFDDRDVMIFPEKINGKFWMVSRGIERTSSNDKIYKNKKPAIFISSSNDMMRFENYELLFEGKEDWESAKIGASIPPLKTKDGYVLVYHGVSEKDRNYRIGAVILDLKDPKKVLYRTKHYLFEPKEKFETEGYYCGCVFPTSIVNRNGKLFIYYGAGDKVIGLCFADLKELVKFIKEDSK